MSVIRWEEPGPEPYYEEDRWAHEIAAQLRDRPGEWAVVYESRTPDEVRQQVRALAGHRHVWPTARWRGDVLTLYACWSMTKPEPTSTSAMVVPFPSTSKRSVGDSVSPETAGDAERPDETDRPGPRKRRWRRH